MTITVMFKDNVTTLFVYVGTNGSFYEEPQVCTDNNDNAEIGMFISKHQVSAFCTSCS